VDIKAYSPLRVPRRGDAALVAPITMSSVNDINTNSSVGDPKPVVLQEGEELYTVQQGNTMFSIAKQFGMEVEELKALNGLSSNQLVVGQKIKVKKKQ